MGLTLTEVSLLVNIGTSVFAVFSWLQWRLTRAQLQLQLVSDFHDQLLKLHEDLDDIRHFDHYGDLRPEHRKVVGLYIKMCADQYYKWRTGIIPRRLWSEWDKQIRDRFGHPVFQSAWHDGHHRENYVGDFVGHLDNIITQSTNEHYA